MVPSPAFGDVGWTATALTVVGCPLLSRQLVRRSAARVGAAMGVAVGSSTRRPGTLETGTSTSGPQRPTGHGQPATTKGQHTTMISQRKGATAGVAAAALLALSLTTGFGGTPRSTPPTEPAASGSAAGGGGDLV